MTIFLFIKEEYFVSILLALTISAATTVMYWFEPLFNRMPLFIQRPIYNDWKIDIIKITKNSSNPIVSFPMLIFIELSLDDYFKKGGIKAARKALTEKTKELDSKFDKFAEALSQTGEQHEQARTN